MRICVILEGCYPYVHGGVSTWIHQYIQRMPEHEFVLWLIGAREESRGKFVYELPKNVTEVHEVFLDTALRLPDRGRLNQRFTPEEQNALKELMNCGRPDWDVIFRLYQQKKVNPIAFLKSAGFLDMLTQLCQREYPYVPYADAFHTLRSMMLPLMYLLGTPVPQADVYHAICTGYGGMLASLGSWLYRRPLLLTEHGIYTREREEELIRAQWVKPAFKKQWIHFFYMLSDLIYRRSFRVTSLFSNARLTQISLGVEAERCLVIRNGIDYERMASVPEKPDDGWVDIGAIVRLAPIKDIKTLLYAFYELSSRRERVRLHILGGVDDPEYAEECYALARDMKLSNLRFTGRVDVVSYMAKLDFTVLTSISEGQPLSVLESFAAGRPCVTTDVGCCRELLYGAEGDGFGPAGYCVPPMYQQGLADALERMSESRSRRLQMGKNGQARVNAFFRHEQMMENYKKLYQEVEAHHGGHRI